jgi:hypothetical protein
VIAHASAAGSVSGYVLASAAPSSVRVDARPEAIQPGRQADVGRVGRLRLHPDKVLERVGRGHARVTLEQPLARERGSIQCPAVDQLSASGVDANVAGDPGSLVVVAGNEMVTGGGARAVKVPPRRPRGGASC